MSQKTTLKTKLLLIAALAAAFVSPSLYLPALAQSSDAVQVTLPVGVPPPDPETPVTPAGDGIPPHIFNLQIKPDYRSVVLSWETYEPAASRVNWGRTRDYESGSIAGNLFLTLHETKIENLRDGILYAFRITTVDLSGNQAAHEEYFWTLSAPKLELPPNVSNFIVVPVDGVLALTWGNPVFDGFDRVRVVRSDRYYPPDPKEGLVVYEGTRNSAVDLRAVVGVKYFYAAYVYDTSERFSSGALTSGMLPLPETPGKEPATPPSPDRPNIPSSPVTPPREQEPYQLALTDFDFSQEGEKISFSSGRIEVDGELPTLVSLPSEKLVEPGKFLMVTLKDATGEEKSYYFRYNIDKKTQEAMLPAFDAAGAYSMSINVYSAKRRLLKELKAEMVVGGLLAKKGPVTHSQSYYLLIYLLLAALLILILFILILLMRKRRRSNR